MKIRSFNGERVYLVLGCVIFGAVLAVSAFCLCLLNRTTVFSQYHKLSAIPMLKELPHNQPIPLRVQKDSKNPSHKLEAMTDREDLGLMMLDTDSGKRRILWTSGNLEKWLPGERAEFVVSLGEPCPSSQEKLFTLICTGKQGSEYQIHLQGERKFNLDDWRDVLAKECDCANLVQTPSE